MSTREEKIQLATEVDSSGALQGLKRIEDSAASMARSVSDSASKAGAGIDAMGTSGAQASAKLDANTRSIVASIQRATAAAEAGEKGTAKFFESLGRQRGADVGALQPYLQQLEQARKRTDSLTISTGQYTNALRMVPAQMTDVVTSLASGQDPLLVLIQQGGQLKDQFGGAGEAAKAIGRYAVGLVNPITVTAAAAAGLALAFEAGRKESALLAITAATTASTLGVTAGQMDAMVSKLSGAGYSRNAISTALVEVATNGRVAIETLEQYTLLAAELEKYTGQGVAETAKAFKALADEPTKATLKLNEALGFLTQSQYEQIKALEEQGRKTEAARIAQAAYADAVKPTIEAYKANMGALETAMDFWARKGKSMWDAITGIGRSDTGEERIAAARAKLEQMRTRGGGFGQSAADRKAMIQAAQDELTYLERVTQAVRDNAAAEAKRQATQRAGIEASSAVESAQNKGLGKQQQLNKALNDYREGLDKIRAANPESALLNPERVAAGEKAIREQFKETAAARVKAEDTQLASLRAKIAAEDEALRRLQTYGLAADKLTEGEHEVLRLQQLVAVATDAKTRAQLQAQLAAEQELATRQQATANLREALEWEEKLAQARVKGYQEAIRAEEQRIAQRERGLQSLQQQVERLQDEERANVIAAASNVSLATAVEMVGLARVKEAQAKALSEGADGATLLALQREIEMREKLIGLMSNRDARTASERAAKDAAAEWQRTTDEIERSLTDALMRGFESGKDFAEVLRDTVVNMFKTMVLRPVIQAVVQGGMGAMGMGGPEQGGGDGSALSNAYSLYNNASTAYTLGSQWMGGTMSTANVGGTMWANATGTGIDGLLATNGAYGTAPGAATSGWMGTTAGGIGLSAAGGLSAYGYGQRYGAVGGFIGGAGTVAAAGAVSGAVAGTGATAGAASALGAVPVWGWIAIAALAILGSLDDSGTVHAGGAGSYSKAQGSKSGKRVDGLDFAIDYENAGVSQGAASLSQALVDVLDTTAKTFGKDASYWAATGFADDSSGDGAWGALNIMRDGQSLIDWKQGKDKWPGREFADGEKGYTEYLDAISKDVRDLLIESTPDWADAMLTGLGDSVTMDGLSTVVTQINQIQGALEGMGAAMPQLADLTGEATSALLAMFGNIENLSAASASYYQNFYTEAERADFATRQITAAMADLGVAMPASREGFRALVEAQDLNTEAGRKTYAALLQLSPAFKTVADAAVAAAQSMASAWAQVLQARGSTDVDRFTAQAQIDSAWAEYKATDRYGIGAPEWFKTITQDDFKNYTTREQQLIAAIVQGYAKLNASSGANGSAGSYFSELQSLTNSALDGLSRAIEAERELADLSAQSAREAVSAMEAVFGVIDTSLQSLYGQSTAVVRQSAMEARALIAQAVGGASMPGSNELQAAIQAVQGGFDQTVYTTSFDAERDRLRFAAELRRLRETGGEQMTLAEQQLKAAEDQLTSLQAQLDAGRESVDVLRGIDTSVKSVSEAVAALQVALLAEQRGALASGGATSGGGSSSSGASGAAAGSGSVPGATYVPATQGGFSIGGVDPGSSALSSDPASQIAAWEASGKPWTVSYLPGVGPVIVGSSTDKPLTETQEKWLRQAGVPGFAGGGDHFGGVRIVGERGPELEFTGPSRIVNHENTRRLLQGGGANTERMEAELRALREENRAQARALVALQTRMTKVLERWDGRGLPEERVLT